MKRSLLKKTAQNLSLFLLIIIGLQLKASVHFSENFTAPYYPTGSWTNGAYTLSSGSWDSQYAMGLDALNAYNGSGYAVKLNRFLESYLVTPAVNSVGTVSFYYRNFSTILGGGTFKVQKSVNNGAYTDISTVTFTSATAYTYYSVAINDANSNVKIRIYCPTTNSSYLCVDELIVTDMGQTLTTNPSALTGFNYYVGSGPSTAQNFNLMGSNLTGFPGNIAIAAPTDYEVSTDNISFSTSANIPYGAASLSAPVYVRLKAGLALGTYNSESITISGGGAPTFTVPCNGSVTTPPPPTIVVNPTTLSGFNYVFGAGPSVTQSYTISGTYLTGYPGNIVATAPADYELSLDYANYSSTLNIPYNTATLSSVIVYVRLKAGLAVNTYNSEIITNIGGGTSTNVTCNGTVSTPPSPVVSVTPNTLSGFNYTLGSGPSSVQSYNLNGANLTGFPSSITITAPTNYEVCLTNNGTFTPTVSISYTSATLTSTPIYVRLKAGLAIGTYNSEIIANAGGGGTTANVTCNGSVTAAPSPMLTVNPTSLSGFTYIVGAGPSAVQSYNLSGTYLTGFPSTITVTAPTNYEVCLTNNGTFTPTVSVSYTSATITSTPIYVRLKAGLAIGTYNSETITNAGGGATTVNVTCSGNVTAAPSPLLALSSTSLTGLNYIVGSGPSSVQSYNLTGTNLTGFPSSITVTAPTNYEVCLTNNGTFTPTISVSYTSATITSTPIYVRLKAGLAIGTYNSETITNAGGGATTVNVTCSGSVTDIPTGPCFSENFSGFTTGTHAVPGTVDLSSTLNTYTQTTGWSGVKVFSANGEVKLGSSSAAGSVTTPTIDLSSGGSVSFDIQVYGTDAGLIQVFHAPDGVTFTQMGSDITPPATYTTQTIPITGGTALSKIRIGTTQKRVYLDSIRVNCGGSTPTPMLTVNPNTLTGFTYIAGSGPSAEQSYTVSGTNLNGSNVTITPSTNYEISQTSGTGFASTPIVLTAFNGTSNPIYVRLKAGLTTGNYNSEIITNAGGGATTVNVTCSGNVTAPPTPILTVNPTTLTGFTYVAGSGPSAQQSYAISGTNLNGGNVTITPSTNYEISQTSGTGFVSTPIVLTAFNGTSTTIYVRLKAGLTTGNFNSEIITNAGGGATTVNVTCSGNVTAAPTPILTVTPNTLTGFTYIAGSGPSAEQSYTVSGTNLNGSNVTITPSTNYEISQTSGTGFVSTPIVLTAFNGTSTTIYVRLKAGLTTGNYNTEIITNAGGGATTVNITCSGNVTEDVSVTDYVENCSVSLFPNPFNERLTISITGNDQNIDLSLFDITGKLVLENNTINIGTYDLNTASLATGVYTLRVRSKGRCEVMKVVKR